jgi:hypothetical protein
MNDEMETTREPSVLKKKNATLKELDDARICGQMLRQMVETGESMEDAAEALTYSKDIIARQIPEQHLKYFSNTSKTLPQCRTSSWTRAEACTFFINLHKAICMDVEWIKYLLSKVSMM